MSAGSRTRSCQSVRGRFYARSGGWMRRCADRRLSLMGACSRLRPMRHDQQKTDGTSITTDSANHRGRSDQKCPGCTGTPPPAGCPAPTPTLSEFHRSYMPVVVTGDAAAPAGRRLTGRHDQALFRVCPPARRCHRRRKYAMAETVRAGQTSVDVVVDVLPLRARRSRSCFQRRQPDQQRGRCTPRPGARIVRLRGAPV
jgi:hypothetical protein